MRLKKIETEIEVYRFDELSESDQALVNQAKAATERSYAPYSKFQVGAALRLANDVVLQGNILKFSQNEELLADLKKYKDKIFVEASPEDKIWGIGLHYDDDRVLDESLWNGQNLLGKVINEVAKILIK